MIRIFRFLVLPILLFAFMTTGAFADWCQNPEGGFVICAGDPPSSWHECPGGFLGETAWCYPTADNASGNSKKNDYTKTILISAAVGLVFVGVMWYIFKTPKSDNIDGQVKLAAF